MQSKWGWKEDGCATMSYWFLARWIGLIFLCMGILVDEIWLVYLVVPDLWIYQDTYMHYDLDFDQDRHKLMFEMKIYDDCKSEAIEKPNTKKV